MTTAAPIRTAGLSKVYRLGFFMNRRVQALEHLDLEVEPGQVYGLLGPNGAGKSTTIKILMNLVQATSGEASLFGTAPTDRAVRRRIGFLPENPAPYEYLTGREFVTLAGRLASMTRHELEGRVRTVLSEVGMERAADLQIRRYSKGMIQRVALAQALVHRPELLILDEPTSGLDPVGRRQMRDLILAERQRGTTVLFCTHIIPDVEAVCDRVAVLVKGRRVREGSVQELLMTGVPLVELQVEGVSREALQTLLGTAEARIETVGGRLMVSVGDETAQGLMRNVLAAGGRVVRVQPARFSLEDLFLQALSDVEQGSVGGMIS